MIKIYITQFDHDRLMKLLNKRKPYDEYDKALLVELESAEIVEPKDVPPDVVTMNSQLRLEDEQGDYWEYWLVFPEDADMSTNRISILSPIGCALLGYSKGNTITIPTPKGRKKLTIEKVIHQPEREGSFDL